MSDIVDSRLLAERDRCLREVARALDLASEYQLPPAVISAISVLALAADRIGTLRANQDKPTVRPPATGWDEVTPVWPRRR